jgi:hypothetical protein
MKNGLTCLAIAVLALGFSNIASADSINEVWHCTVKDEKSLDDVQAVNSKWLAMVREHVSKDIASSVVSSIVGDSTSFLFVDIYPDLATWEKSKTYLRDNEAADELFADVSDCSQNYLYYAEPTK